MKIYPLFFFLILFSLPAQEDATAFVYGDLLPDAPKLAARGNYTVGVRTLKVIHKNQVDVLNTKGEETVYYDRPLTLEIWYPAQVQEDKIPLIEYEEVMGNQNDPKRPLIPFTFLGRSVRDAAPLKESNPFPLVLVSHGYTGSRYLMTYLTENLASKGYVVVAIDHTDSTFRDANAFTSTLLNRSLDDLFVLEEIHQLSLNTTHFLSGIVDANNTALIGYSMGGYGALNVGGAGYSPEAVAFFQGMTQGNKALAQRMMGNAAYTNSFDPRIKAIVALAPWGMERGVWNEDGLKGLKIPTLFVAGNQDDISGYEKGIKAIYKGTIHAERYLLTYENARHNVAPNPPPKEALAKGLELNEYLRYADSVWDMRRINNINQHFITAYLGVKLKNKTDFLPYLNAEQLKTQDPWEGFLPRTSVGLQLDYAPGQVGY
ncbi:MAG: alpha/beta hydrolase family protein [Flavobacteriaceae bacterium]